MKSNHWKLYPALLVIIFGSLASVTVRGQSNVPELPRTRLDTTYVPPSGNLIAVASGANLQAAVDAANPGDTILLQAGASFIGNFTLPNKAAAAWIIIRSSAADAQLPPPGSRALPAFSSLMPKLISANAAPVLSCAAGAHHFRFIGVEFAMAAGSTLNYGLVNFSAASQTALEQVPHDLIVDRCYLHGNNTGDVSRGVALNSARTAIIDSTISNIHGLGFDTQAICGWNGPGPFKITNNYLEAAGENLLFGGADPAIVGLVPSDIELQGNTLTKPVAWRTAAWSIKNLLELKNAQRVLINGNDFSNCWLQSQVGIAILLTPRNQQGTAPWSVVQDITFSNNAVRHAAGGLNITGTDDLYSSQPTQRVAIRNNLFEDINGAAWGSGDGRLLMFTGISNLTIDHNTGFASGDFACVYGQPTSHLVFSNNVVANGNYGFFGDNVGIGNPALNTYCPAALFAKNAIIGAQAAGSAPSNYPANNYFPVDNNAVQFSDWANKNYQLAATSPYKNAALDGKDVGADLVALLAALGQTGTAAPGNQPPTVSISASVGSGVAPLVVSFACVAADGDGQVVAYHWDFGDGQAATAPVTSHLYQAAGSYTAQITVTDNLGATASASVNITVTVQQPATGANNAQFISQTAPLQVTAGSRFHHLITMNNTGTSTWQIQNGFRICSQNSADNTTWGRDRFEIQQSVAPGATTTFDLFIIAPEVAGTYNLQWRLVQGLPGTPFGDQTPNLSITVTASSTDKDNDGIPDNLEAEFGLNPNLKDNDVYGNNLLFVKQLYRDLLGREGPRGPQDVDYWVNELTHGVTKAEVGARFFTAPEFYIKTAVVMKMYFISFGRLPDYEGIRYWLDQSASGQNNEAVANGFLGANEFQASHQGLSNDQFVNLMYQSSVSRMPTQAEMNQRLYEMSTGRTRGYLLADLAANSLEYNELVTNKVQIVEMYLALLRRIPTTSEYNHWVGIWSSATTEAQRTQQRMSMVDVIMTGTDPNIASPYRYRTRVLP